jgi:sucrose-phosphate synthase
LASKSERHKGNSTAFKRLFPVLLHKQFCYPRGVHGSFGYSQDCFEHRCKRMEKNAMNHNERSFQKLVVSDVDNTLLVDDALSPGQRGDEMALECLRRELEQHPALGFGVASGRSLALVLDVQARYPNFPQPAFYITDVGSEVYWNENGSFMVDDDFQNYICHTWDRSAILEVLNGFGFLTLQEVEKQRPTKVSFYTGEDFDLSLVQEALVGLPCNVIFSHGEFLDVLPERASKAHAIRFVSEKLGISTEEVAAVGDSGNDRDMITEYKGIAVGNYAQDLENLVGHPNVYFARASYAAGVLEGLRHYGFLPSV